MRATLLALVSVCAVLALPASPAPGADGCDAATLLAATSGDEDGIGGTGFGDDDSGIGGTGRGGDDSGIGGTGRGGDDSGIGGTGIFGTITGFGSVCVNGLEIEYEDGVAVTVNGSPGDVHDLAIGRVVWIEATSGDGGLEAELLSLWSAVIGNVEAVDRETSTFRVFDQWVEVPDTAVVFESVGAGGIDRIEVGELVDVSGLRAGDGLVVASRIDRAPVGVERLVASPRLAEVLGEAVGVRVVSIEGFVQARPERHRFGIDGIDVTSTQAAPRAGTRVWVAGPRTGATALTADRIVATPELPGGSPNSGSEIEPLDDAAKLERETSSPERIDSDGMVKTRSTDRLTVDDAAGPSDGDLGDPTREVAGPTVRIDSDGIDAPKAPDQPDRLDRADTTDRQERADVPDRPERPDRPDLADRPELPDRPDRPDVDFRR